jgi:hydroxymethylbilane synthase
VKEIEQALLAGEIDFAVHSCKDMPVTMPLVDQSDLMIAAIPARLDPRDCLISTVGTTIDGLPRQCRVATGSLRRQCQMLSRRSDLQIQPIRGNIDTRIKKLRAGEFGATLLAMAGLARAGLFDSSLMHPLAFEEMLPAPGQGALVLQCRRSDLKTREILAKLDHPNARAAVDAERAVVAALNCDCHSPIAVLAEIDSLTLRMRAAMGGRDGQPPVKYAIAEYPAGQGERAVEEIVLRLSV